MTDPKNQMWGERFVNWLRDSLSRSRRETDKERKDRMTRTEQTFRFLIIIITVSQPILISGFIPNLSPIQIIGLSFAPLVAAITFWTIGQLSPHPSVRIICSSIAWAPAFFSAIYLSGMLIASVIVVNAILKEIIVVSIGGIALLYTPIQVTNVFKLMIRLEPNTWVAKRRHAGRLIGFISAIIFVGLFSLWFVPSYRLEFLVMVILIVWVLIGLGGYTIRELFTPIPPGVPKEANITQLQGC